MFVFPTRVLCASFCENLRTLLFHTVMFYTLYFASFHLAFSSDLRSETLRFGSAGFNRFPSAGRALSRVITTENGQVQGFINDKVNPAIERYYGIPYAKPPVRHRRFMRPEPFDASYSWSGIRDASSPAPPCTQFLNGLYGDIIGSEDCLYLDIYCPISANDTVSLPVMFFIPGGAFTTGSSHFIWGLYDGANLAEAEHAIVIVINYRTHIFGFLFNDDFERLNNGSVGNLGMQDQREALRWVKRNINSFGGDPSRVLLFGQSAGAISVAWHLVSPVSEREQLFSAAVLMSSVTWQTWFYQDKGDAADVFTNFIEYVGGSLHALSAESLMAAWTEWAEGVTAEVYSGVVDEKFPAPAKIPQLFRIAPFGPVVDLHEDGLLGRPLELVRQGRCFKVPIIIGTTQDESSLFTFAVGLNTQHQTLFLPVDAMAMDVHEEVPLAMVEFMLQEQGLLDELREVYGEPGKRKKQWMDRVLRDSNFACSTEAFAEAWSEVSNVWLYLYAFPAPPVIDSFLGSCHTCDIPVLFKNFAGINVVSNHEKFTDLSNKLGRWWSNMARCKAPTCKASEPKWNRFTAKSRSIALFEIEGDQVYRNTRTHLLPSLQWPSSKQCSFWDRPNLDWVSVRGETSLDATGLLNMSETARSQYACNHCKVNEALLEL